MATLTSSVCSRGASPNISPKRSHSPSRNLQCSLCLQSFNDARILPCLHSFCAVCLEKQCVQSLNTRPSVYCPVCMDETQLNSRGIEGLPKNLYVKHLLDLQDSAGNDTRKCDLCVVKAMASHYCQVCSYNLCSLCSQAHQREQKTTQHELILIESMSQSLTLDSIMNGHGAKSPVFHCKIHRGETTSVFCETCSVPLCQKCPITEHRGHHLNLMDTATRQQEEVLRNLMTRTKPFLVSLDDSLKNIEFIAKSVEEKAQAVAEEICDSIDERMKALQEYKRLLLSELGAIKTQKLNTLHQQQEELVKTFDSISALSNIASTALKEHSSTSVFTTNQPLIAELETVIGADQDLTPREDDYIQYHPNSPGIEIKGVKMFGTLDSRGPSAAHSVADGGGLFEARLGEETSFRVTVNDRFKQRRISGEDNIECKIQTSDGCFISPTLKNLGKGVVKFFYTPEASGEHRVSVLIQGKHIRSSPFIVDVLPKGGKHSGVFHCCSWCSSSGKKHVRCGCGSRMPGGYSGCGHGHLGHPGCNHWSCCGSRKKNSDCTLYS